MNLFNDHLSGRVASVSSGEEYNPYRNCLTVFFLVCLFAYFPVWEIKTLAFRQIVGFQFRADLSRVKSQAITHLVSVFCN